MDIRISEDALPGLRRDGDDYIVQLAQVPLVAQALRDLADNLEDQYNEAE